VKVHENGSLLIWRGQLLLYPAEPVYYPLPQQQLMTADPSDLKKLKMMVGALYAESFPEDVATRRRLQIWEPQEREDVGRKLRVKGRIFLCQCDFEVVVVEY
jgi:hypothetical protein